MNIGIQFSGHRASKDNNFQNLEERFGIEYEKLRIGIEPIITDNLIDITNEIGTRLEGLEFSVKTASSIEDKLNRSRYEYRKGIINDEASRNLPDWNADMSFNKMCSFKDIIRYTEICEHDDIINVSNKTISSLEKEGYVLSGVKNYYADPYPETGYKGVHLNFITPFGQEMELQVHSKESFKAKQDEHELYEEFRICTADDENRNVIKQKIREVFNKVKYPKNYQDLHKFSINEEKKQKIINERKLSTDVLIQKKELEYSSYALVVSTYKNNELVYTGFENKYLDGSMKEYRNFTEKEYALEFNLYDGKVISAERAPEFIPNLDKVVEEHLDLTGSHLEYMDKNFANKLREDVEFNSPKEEFQKLTDEKPINKNIDVVR